MLVDVGGLSTFASKGPAIGFERRTLRFACSANVVEGRREY
jgi:hypothetical protein